MQVLKWNNEKEELQKKDSLLEAFAIPLQEHMVLAFTGGGGKTTAMFSLADELAAQGKRVIVTTSTHIFYPPNRVVAEADNWESVSHFLASRENPFSSLKGWVLVTGQPARDGKLKGMDLSQLFKLTSLCDVLLVEADGAKRYPVKIPREGEPVLLKETHAVIGCMGLDSIGKTWEEGCFRQELAHQIFDSQKKGRFITPEAAAKILISPYGTRKGTESMEYRILLNKADDEVRVSQAIDIIKVVGDVWAENCVITSFFTP